MVCNVRGFENYDDDGRMIRVESCDGRHVRKLMTMRIECDDVPCI
jgi:hypothetical protein